MFNSENLGKLAVLEHGDLQKSGLHSVIASVIKQEKDSKKMHFMRENTY